MIFFINRGVGRFKFKSSLIAPVDRYTYEPLNLYELEEIKGKNESQSKNL